MSVIKFDPAEDRLLIEVEDETTDSGIALPEGVKRDSYRIGRVLKIGKDVTIGFLVIGDRTPDSVNQVEKKLIGKRVVFERYGPLHLKQFNEKWYLARQQYILGIIEEE